MEQVLATLNSQVSPKGRNFLGETAFLNWLSEIAQFKRHGLTVADFFTHFQSLVETGRVSVTTKSGAVKVRVNNG